MTVFEIVVVLNPTEKEKRDGAIPQIVVPITAVVAHNAEGAKLQAYRLIPEEHAKHTDRLEVAVRPFRA